MKKYITKDKITQTLQNPLIFGSFVIFITSQIGNFFNFLFTLYMSRNLTASDYSTFVSLISIMMLSTLPAGSIVPTVVNFAASYFAKGEKDKVRGLFIKVSKAMLVVGVLFFLFFLIFSQNIADFFRIQDSSHIVIIGIIVLLGFLSVVNTALLQAKLAFLFISLSGLLTSFLKLVFGVSLVWLGYSVSGGLWALLLASSIPYAISFLPLRFVFQKGVKTPHISGRELVAYGAPTALTMFGLTSFISTDILLVKHFFNPTDAGIYAAGLSLVGRVIYFFSAPIGTVMFPIIIRKYTNGENYHKILWQAFLIVLLPSTFLVISYFLIPSIIIKLLVKREEYVTVAGLLGIFGIFTTIYSLLYVVTTFYLSIKKTWVFIPITLGALLQFVGIWIYHENFLQVILISLTITSLLLIYLLLYYYRILYGKKKTST
jgi:O-antigen/teichoic acid export membrane protein